MSAPSSYPSTGSGVRPAAYDDIGAMVDLLHRKMNRKFSPDRWRGLFDYAWCPDKPDYGRVAVVNGEIVGCCVAIYSHRVFEGQTYQVSNPCAWYLDKTARGTGLGLELMADVTSDPAWHYHICSSSKLTTGLLERIGFEILDTEKLVWPGAPSDPSDRDTTGAKLPLSHDLSEFADLGKDCVPEAQACVVRDHAMPSVTPLHFADAGSGEIVSVLLALTVKDNDVHWADVLYASDGDGLVRAGPAIAAYLSVQHPVMLAADARLCGAAGSETARDARTGQGSRSDGDARNGKDAGNAADVVQSHSPPERHQLDPPRFWKSSGGVPKAALDHAYSEVPLLRLKLG